MNATMNIDTTSFNRQLEMLRRANGKAGGSCVKYWARKALRKIAFETNKASRHFIRSGRLRAGWWPAAEALNVPTVYAGAHGNAGEGSYVDATANQTNPSFTMTNSVAFIGHVAGLEPRIAGGIRQLESQAHAEWEREYHRNLKLMAPGVA